MRVERLVRLYLAAGVHDRGFDPSGIVAQVAERESKVRVDRCVLGAAARHCNRHLVAVPLNLQRATFVDARALHRRECLDRVLAVFRRHAIGAKSGHRGLAVLRAGLVHFPQAGLKLDGGARRQRGHEAEDRSERKHAVRRFEHQIPQ